MALRGRFTRQRLSSRARAIACLAALCGAALLAGGNAAAQDPSPPADAPQPKQNVLSVSGNPAAVNESTGTGWLGRTLGLRDEWGIRLGGVWLADTNVVVAGGATPGGWTNNSALFIGLNVDAEKLVDWRGATFGFVFLQFNGSDSNADAGSLAGYNGIVGLPPFNRTELFKAWYGQEIIKDVLKARIGRMDPTVDFGNVTRPVTFTDVTQNIPAVSGLIWSPIFANGSMIGAVPGYYNVGNGAVVTFTPDKSFYVNVGAYDGNRARGIQTGINPPLFNGYYFNIAEIGTDWTLGEGNHPGQFGIGLWRQTGVISFGGVTEDGFGGFYLFGSQQIAHGVNKQVPSSAITMFYQFGANSSQTLPIREYYGAGMTAFGLVGSREQDSMGFGVGLSRPNPNLFTRQYELMFQAYYQAHLVAGTFLQPTVTYIPTPGVSASLPGALMTTLRLTVLF
jgi:porin